MDFRSNVDDLFNDFCIIFRHDFWIDFWYFSKRRFFVFQCADFVKIIVFLKEKRRFYNFTELWKKWSFTKNPIKIHQKITLLKTRPKSILSRHLSPPWPPKIDFWWFWHRFWHHFGTLFSSKIHAKFDAKNDAEKVMKNDEKWCENG